MSSPSPAPRIPSPDEFRASLHRHGLKATRQRMAIHGVMTELVHASADQVCEELARKGVKVTQASVYNILTQLADCRIYGRRFSAASKMYFDVLVRPHVHLYDRQNHCYRDIADEALVEKVNAHLKRRKFRGYTIESIDIQYVVRPTGRGKKK